MATYHNWTDVEFSYDYAEAIETGAINLAWTEYGRREIQLEVMVLTSASSDDVELEMDPH